jgi:hypothetical protein
MYHLSEEPGRICATRKTENVDVVSRLIVTHDEVVALQKMLLERGTDCLVDCIDDT